jgi:Fur family transcriptional regulator, ferric uptake regulator
VSHDQIEYATLLHRAGYRVTHQRVVILDAICQGRGHTTLKQILARVRHTDSSIDRSSLYRTLKLFVDVGLVFSATTDDGETWYEIARPAPHHHLVCRRCGHEQEISHAIVHALSTTLLQQYGFEAQPVHLIFSGLCGACRSKPT